MNFLMYPDERSAVFIDSVNLHLAARGLGFEVDYQRLLVYCASRSRLVRAHFYAAAPVSQEAPGIRPLTDWLSYNGYMVTLREQREIEDSARHVRSLLNMDLALDVYDLAPMIDHAILFSGDGDFVPLVQAIQRRGVRVTVVSTIKTASSMAADDLRRVADRFVELSGLIDELGRLPPAAPLSGTLSPRGVVSGKANRLGTRVRVG